jgi:hypothetical protein
MFQFPIPFIEVMPKYVQKPVSTSLLPIKHRGTRITDGIKDIKLASRKRTCSAWAGDATVCARGHRTVTLKVGTAHRDSEGGTRMPLGPLNGERRPCPTCVADLPERATPVSSASDRRHPETSFFPRLSVGKAIWDQPALVGGETRSVALALRQGRGIARPPLYLGGTTPCRIAA